ncbi:MAG: SPOR domain-containing protein [Proteobacteria bacterium]|nr:SPOR domain-containing protein [Pseudomonadota bacterium]
MPTSITFRAGALALLAVAALAGCSREQQDWRAAEAAGTSEAFDRFIRQHPDSELASHARARLAQVLEQRAWQHAQAAGTLEGYREFLAQHPAGRLAEEARIRIEGFSLGSTPRISAAAPTSSLQGVNGVRAMQLADAGTSSASGPTGQAAVSPQSPVLQPGRAMPGEEARADASDSVTAPQGVTTAAAMTGYAVQLGAFGNPTSAGREWQRLQARFGEQFAGVTPRIVAAEGPSGPMFRLQAPEADETRARAICEALRAQAQSCVPVLPQVPK